MQHASCPRESYSCEVRARVSPRPSTMSNVGFRRALQGNSSARRTSFKVVRRPPLAGGWGGRSRDGGAARGARAGDSTARAGGAARQAGAAPGAEGAPSIAAQAPARVRGGRGSRGGDVGADATQTQRAVRRRTSRARESSHPACRARRPRPGPNPGPGSDGRVGILQPLGRHRRAAPGNAAGGLDPQAPRASTGRRARLPAPRGGRGRSECVGLPDASHRRPTGRGGRRGMRSRARGGWRRRPREAPRGPGRRAHPSGQNRQVRPGVHAPAANPGRDESRGCAVRQPRQGVLRRRVRQARGRDFTRRGDRSRRAGVQGGDILRVSRGLGRRVAHVQDRVRRSGGGARRVGGGGGGRRRDAGCRHGRRR